MDGEGNMTAEWEAPLFDWV